MKKNRDMKRILIRGVNWVGDAIMTTPAVAAVRENFPDAHIAVLAKKWVAPVYAEHPAVDEVIVLDKDGPHKGIKGLFRIAGEIRKKRFDLAVLFQNAIEAALIVRLAGVPVRMGYDTDARGFLLNRKVKLRPEDKKIHETEYYLRILTRSGLKGEWSKPVFHLSPDAVQQALNVLKDVGIPADSFILGLAPGAAYGPAKQWPAERYAAAADRILEEKNGSAVIFGSKGEAQVAETLQNHMTRRVVNLAGETDLTTAAALIKTCGLFLTNDSGLMHMAAAVDAPIVAIFGSTNPETTSPADGRFIMIRREVECSPCLKPTCEQPSHKCMELVTVDDVVEASFRLLKKIGEE